MTTKSLTYQSESFSASRLGLLIRMHILSSYRSWLTTGAVAAGLILIASMLSGPDNTGFYLAALTNIVIFIGVYFTSRSFRELHDKTKNESYLLIPASAFEKTLARLLVSTVGFIISAFSFVFIVSILSELIKPLLFGPKLPIFNPFRIESLELIKFYLFIQSIYFLGAAWFKNNHLIKTLLAQLIIVIGLALFAFIVVLIAFEPYIGANLDFSIEVEQFPRDFITSIEPLAKLGMALLTVACWAIAWMKVKETEVSEGV